MKNLLFVTSFGLAVVFSNAAFGQDVKDGDKPKQEKKYNPRSNASHNANKTVGTTRAATVKEMNGETAKMAGNTEEHQAKKAGDSVENADKQAKKVQKKQEKEARKLEKERLKAEKKMVKKNKLKK